MRPSCGRDQGDRRDRVSVGRCKCSGNSDRVIAHRIPGAPQIVVVAKERRPTAIGLAEQIGLAYFPTYAIVLTFLIMVLVLAVRPQGLLAGR